MNDRICILVVSHNNPEITNNLCDQIIRNTKDIDYDLHVIETGSNLQKVSKYMTLWVADQCRMTRGFNLLKQYADFVAKNRGQEYFAYHLFVNDASLKEGENIVKSLYDDMKGIPDCGQIHPYQFVSQGPQVLMNKVRQSGVRKESFVEIVCPMLRASAWNEIPDLLDNRLYYGWGLDYSIPTGLYSKGFRTYISDNVGVFHTPFTSYKNQIITEEVFDIPAFITTARQDMNEAMLLKYGENWKQYLLNQVPSDVSDIALRSWLTSNDGYVG